MITQTQTHTRFSGYLGGHQVGMYVLDCASCGVIFAITTDYEQRRRDDSKGFNCPNGHSNSWHESKADREQKRAERAEQQAKWANARADRIQSERQAAEWQARAYKGHVTRLRNRIAAGVCPVQSCRRNFTNVKSHIASQHPEWAHDHPEALS